MKLNDIKEKLTPHQFEAAQALALKIRADYDNYDMYSNMLAELLETDVPDARRTSKNLRTNKLKNMSAFGIEMSKLSDVMTLIAYGHDADFVQTTAFPEYVTLNNLHKFDEFVIGSLHDRLIDDFKEKHDIDLSQADQHFMRLFYLLYSQTLTMFLENYFKNTEGAAMSVDKAVFAHKQLVEFFKTGHHQPLQVNYKEDATHPELTGRTYWSSTKIPDTKALSKIIITHLCL